MGVGGWAFTGATLGKLERVPVQTTHPVALRAGVVSLLMGLVFALTMPFAHATDGKLVLDKGHVDAFNIVPDGNKVVLNLKEDVTGSHVQRAPEDVVLKVNESAYQEQTTSIPEVGAPGYLLPLAQDQNLLWPGWDSMATSSIGAKTVDINILDVSGPGRTFLFSQGNFGGLSPLLQGGAFELKSGSVIHQDFPGHVHAYWLFEKSGTYTMRVQATVSTGDKTLTTNEATYTWMVERSAKEPAPEEPVTEPVTEATDEPTVEPTPSEGGETTEPSEGGETTEPSEGDSSEMVTDPSETETTPSNPAKPDQKPAGQKPGAGKSVTVGGGVQNTTPEATCFPKQVGGSGADTLLPRVKDDRTAPAVWRDVSELTFALGDAARAKTPSQIGSIAGGTDVWMIGSTQVKGVPWLGANTQSESLLSKTNGETVFALTSFSGPGQMEVYTSGNFGQVVGQTWFRGSGNSGSGSVTIPRNTHVHPNWVFTKPGVYNVGLSMTTTGKDGKQYTGSTTVRFNVGSNNGVTSGHFDLGPEIGAAGSKTVWQTKDGEPCEPTAVDLEAAGLSGGDLAQTGVTDLTLPLAVFALGIGVLGIGMLRYRARA